MPHEPAFLRVRSWERYQVYHDGRPTKFFSVQAVTDPKTGRTGILDDPSFLRLLNDPECPVFLVMAYAAQTGNKIPNDPVFLRAKLLTEFPVNVTKMLEEHFLEPWTTEVNTNLTNTEKDTSPKTPVKERCTDPYEFSLREEKRREEKTVVAFATTDENSIFEAWLEKAPPLTKHRPSYMKQDKLKRRLNVVLKTYPAADIRQAIENYANVLASEAHFFSHTWTLEHFLTRGLDRFVDEARPLTNFLSDKQNVEPAVREEARREALRRHFDSLKERGVT